MTSLTKLVHHCIWANQHWIDFLETHRDEHLMKVMSHILLGEQAWFQRITGADIDRDIWRAMPHKELQAVQDRHRSIYYELLEQDLTRVLRFQRFTGETGESPISDVLLHVCLHGTHHRGQMATYASQHGIPPLNTDFIQYTISSTTH